MLKLSKIDHVAVAVADLDDAIERYRTILGVEPAVRELVQEQQTEAALLPIGDSNVELIAPKGNVGLERFLEKRGPGLHHIAIEVRDIDGVLRQLQAQGARLIDERPRVGARGHRVAFVHPQTLGGLLVELVEPGE